MSCVTCKHYVFNGGVCANPRSDNYQGWGNSRTTCNEREDRDETFEEMPALWWRGSGIQGLRRAVDL